MKWFAHITNRKSNTFILKSENRFCKMRNLGQRKNTGSRFLKIILNTHLIKCVRNKVFASFSLILLRLKLVSSQGYKAGTIQIYF